MIKILVVNNGYPSKLNPQYSTYISSIVACLQKGGFDVHLCVLNSDYKTKVRKLMRYIEYYLRLLIIDYYQYDIIYIHNIPHSVLPLIHKFKKMRNIYIHWHGTDIHPQSWLQKILNSITYLVIPKRANHLAPSDYFANRVSNTLGINKTDVIISPSGGIDTTIFTPKAKKRRNIIILGFASSLKKEKGIDFVVKLMHESDLIKHQSGYSIKLKCIKYGIDKDNYSNELLRNENEVCLIEPVPKKDMYKFYQSIDLLLLPTRMHESLALVGLEAMSCNVPVVGTNDFAIKEYIINGITGEKFKNGSYEDFYKSVKKALSNLLNYTPRKLVISKYSEEYVVNQYKRLFGA